MPIWPFVRRFVGLVNGSSVPTAADLEALDEQLSRAANGLLWSDVALLKNFTPVTLTGERMNCAIYNPETRNWLALGTTDASSDAHGNRSRDSGSTWAGFALGTLDVDVTPNCAATDGAGLILVGHSASAASASRITWTGDEFATTQTLALGPVGSEQTTAVHYSSRLGLWLAGLSDGSIYSAAHPGGPWTVRQLLTGTIVRSFTESYDRIIAESQTSSKLSLNGTSWSPLVTPALLDSVAFVSEPAPGYFIGRETASDNTYTSPDAVTWTLRGNDPGGITYAMTSYGRIALALVDDGSAVDLRYSLDLGDTWISLKQTNGTSIAFGDDRFLVVRTATNSVIYRGLGGGL
jgi:hypothetical protein